MKNNYLLASLVLLLFPFLSRGEGSKEIYVGGFTTSFFLCSDFVNKCNPWPFNGDRSQFAVYGCQETDRLYFVTNTLDEAVYMGFKGSGAGPGNKIVFRVKDVSGAIVYTQRDLPVTGYGYIPSINEARIGPTQLYGAGGYDALSFHPPAPNTYYIEFDRVSSTTGNPVPGQFNLDLLDITVADTVADLAKPGRLYCKAWQFTEGNNCSATTYVYSSDSIITSATFDDMSGGTWIQFCNQWGCANTGNFVNDRKSLPGTQSLLPQYRIFLNPPDPLLFPAATTLGQIIAPAPWGERFCSNGNIIFHITVDKPGNVEILMTFSGPYVARTLSTSVVAGENLITWDGLDGTTPTGIPVPNNTNITYTIKYINGLTNMPFYDVETNQNGFSIGIVSPPGATPLVFWDDTNIMGGGQNLTGCMSPPGCHTWPNNFGNLNTVNTWWYNVSTSTLPAVIIEFRAPQALVFNQSSPQSYCAGTNGVIFSVQADPNSTTYVWSYTGTGATITQTNPTDAFISVNFAANATSGSIQVYGVNTNCTVNGPTSSLPVTIKPIPSLNPPYSKTICSGSAVNLPLVSTPPGALFSWNGFPPACSGNIQVCPPGLANQTQINDLLTLTDFNPGTVDYHIVPLLNGCNGTMQTVTITVSPNPNVSNSITAFSVCNTGTTNIPLTSSVPGTTFTWTATGSSGNVTGFSNGAGAVITQTLTNTGNAVESVTYHVTPSAFGCTGIPLDFVVTVYPTPTLTNSPPSIQICTNTSPNLTLTSNVAGTQFTWTCTPSSGNVTGWSNNATPTVLLNQTLVNSGLAAEWVTYHMTPASNGCTGPVTDYTVTVLQSPDVFFNPTAQTICSQQTTNIQVLSTVPGTTFTWTASASSGTVTGYSGGSGNSIAQTLTNSGNTIEWVTYQVTPTAFGCPPGPSQNVVVTVNPKPAVNNLVTNFQVCSASTTNIVLSSTVPGSTFTWTASGSSGNVTGYSNGAGMSIVQTLTNTGFNVEAVTYQVIPTANGCPGNATPFVVTVFPVANVLFNPNGQSFCSGGTSSINLSSSAAGTSYTWTVTPSGPSLSGFGPGSGNLIAQTLFNSGTAPGTVTYQVAPTANGCPGTPGSVVVTINPKPLVAFIPCWDPAISLNSQPILLKGATPLGGTYSGAGVLGNTFSPATAGPGVHTITYSYTNTWACSATATASINVITLLPFTCGNTVTDPRDNQGYPTVQIGGQCWMSSNLNYGNTILSSLMQSDNCVSEKYCFGDSPASCTSTGGLYQWDELMKYGAASGAQGFCPPEWHIPTEGDWNTLFAFYISNGFAGSPLKYTGYSGFNAFLTGVRFNNVQWDFSNFAVMYWSSSAHAQRKAWAHGMNTFNPSVSYYPSHRNNAFPVRCIKD